MLGRNYPSLGDTSNDLLDFSDLKGPGTRTPLREAGENLVHHNRPNSAEKA